MTPVSIALGTTAFHRHHRRLLELLTERAFERRQVVLASGKPSNFYIDCKQVTLSSEGHFLVGYLFGALLAKGEAVDAVGGLTMGADPLASAVATLSHIGPSPVDAFYVRKEPKGHGTRQWLEGGKNLQPGAPVAILEDVITTGGSTLLAIERARSAGLDVKRVIALVDRGEGGREAIEAQAPLEALYHRRDFLSELEVVGGPGTAEGAT
jgi:orotate phosphoribosyltransferase